MEKAAEVRNVLIEHLGSQIRVLSDAIVGFSNRLTAGELDREQKKYVMEIHQACSGLSGLVENILDRARMPLKGTETDRISQRLLKILK